MKIEFNKDIELLQGFKTEMMLIMQDLVNQIKSAVWSLLSRMNNVEGRQIIMSKSHGMADGSLCQINVYLEKIHKPTLKGCGSLESYLIIDIEKILN